MDEPRRMAEPAARDAPHDAVRHAHRLAAERDPGRIREGQARELPAHALGALAKQRVAADEVTLSELHREPGPASYGVSSGVMSALQ